jgi:hypothetical protein
VTVTVTALVARWTNTAKSSAVIDETGAVGGSPGTGGASRRMTA